eukprot:4868100-Pleurochrysis_carterae.AAC.1
MPTRATVLPHKQMLAERGCARLMDSRLPDSICTPAQLCTSAPTARVRMCGWRVDARLRAATAPRGHAHQLERTCSRRSALERTHPRSHDHAGTRPRTRVFAPCLLRSSTAPTRSCRWLRC